MADKFDDYNDGIDRDLDSWMNKDKRQERKTLQDEENKLVYKFEEDGTYSASRNTSHMEGRDFYKDDSDVDDKSFRSFVGSENQNTNKTFMGDSDGGHGDWKSYIDKEIKKSKSKFALFKGLALVLVGAVLGSFIGVNLAGNTKFNKGLLGDKTNAVTINANEEMSIENAVAVKATPSVVGITSKYKTQGGFFGMQSQEASSIGSGVIVSEDGYILTNNHVIENNPESISVLFYDNKASEAKVVWKDATLDLAIIKVDGKNLTPIEMGDSDNVRVGDKAIAIGNPVGLNLQSTLTSGYISGLNRSITVDNGVIMDGLFQTDASINSGNSGGALLNKNGQLIGINTAKVRSTDGIGFAIPVNIAKGVVKSVIEKGTFTPVTLGIRGVNLDVYKQYSADKDVGADQGVYVSDIVENSSAANSDLKVGDIIIGLNNQTIESMNKLKQVLLGLKTGDKVNMKVIRNNKEETISITFSDANPNI